MWTIKKIFVEACYNIASVLWFGISGHKSMWDLEALQPGIEPTLPALEGKVNQTAREFPLVYLNNEEENSTCLLRVIAAKHLKRMQFLGLRPVKINLRFTRCVSPGMCLCK